MQVRVARLQREVRRNVLVSVTKVSFVNHFENYPEVFEHLICGSAKIPRNFLPQEFPAKY